MKMQQPHLKKMTFLISTSLLLGGTSHAAIFQKKDCSSADPLFSSTVLNSRSGSRVVYTIAGTTFSEGDIKVTETNRTDIDYKTEPATGNYVVKITYSRKDKSALGSFTLNGKVQNFYSATQLCICNEWETPLADE